MPIINIIRTGTRENKILLLSFILLFDIKSKIKEIRQEEIIKIFEN
jgi:hypothetical protein